MYKPRRRRKRDNKKIIKEKDFPSLVSTKPLSTVPKNSEFVWRKSTTQNTVKIKETTVFDKAKLGFILLNVYPTFPDSPTIPLFQ